MTGWWSQGEGESGGRKGSARSESDLLLRNHFRKVVSVIWYRKDLPQELALKRRRRRRERAAAVAFAPPHLSLLGSLDSALVFQDLEMDGEKQSNRAHRPSKAPKAGPAKGQNPKVRSLLSL